MFPNSVWSQQLKDLQSVAVQELRWVLCVRGICLLMWTLHCSLSSLGSTHKLQSLHWGRVWSRCCGVVCLSMHVGPAHACRQTRLLFLRLKSYI